ncbi:MAG: hypothetical protein PHC86_05365 [Eubacteriales bacterium]|nr:hypothetical protein [Eubacteriales bacterium]
MRKRSRLIKTDEINVVCHGPFGDDVLLARDTEYPVLSDDQFRKKYRHYVFKPASIEIDGKELEIQLNFCNDTFCDNYFLEQHRFSKLKGKPSRYKMDGQSDDTRLKCNSVSYLAHPLYPIPHNTSLISNWSVAEEIKRLLVLETIIPDIKIYEFHHPGCSNAAANPLDNIDLFYRKGITTGKCRKYQCKECMKSTNVRPELHERHNFRQKRNDVLVPLMTQLFTKNNVKGMMENLDMGASTFYHKLEWLYRKCLEFNAIYEAGPLKSKTFDELWLNTDSLIYNLNNIRMRGHGVYNPKNKLDKLPATNIIGSADLKSGYVFRLDIAYDSKVSLEQIEEDTKNFHCDHSNFFLRKNERLSYPFCPQPPTAHDTQSIAEYMKELESFNYRKNYVPGSHVKMQYTAAAHYFLLNKTLKVKQYYFVSDNDSTLQSAIFKIFAKHFSDGYADYFVCQTDKTQTLQEAYNNSRNARTELLEWAATNGVKTRSIWEKAKAKLHEDLKSHKFYNEKTVNGHLVYSMGSNPIKHPLPSLDEGIRKINLINFTQHYSTKELADLIIQVNSRAINNAFQLIHRKISLLERPLVTSRGDGKSYIYANYNPRYAMQILTIFRTYYNFCKTMKYAGVKMTPAQRLGLTNKVFDIKEIIFLD